MFRLATTGFLLTFVLSAAAAPVPKGAGKVSTYFPTTVGSKWVYERDSRVDEVVTVSAVEKDGDDLIVSREGVDGNSTRYAKMVVSNEGLRQPRELADGKVGWLLKSKFESGDSWEVPDGGKRTVYGPEEIKVAAGKFTAARVVWEYDGGTITSWYVPGVGEVRRTEKMPNGNEQVIRSLKSFKPGQQK